MNSVILGVLKEVIADKANGFIVTGTVLPALTTLSWESYYLLSFKALTAESWDLF